MRFVSGLGELSVAVTLTRMDQAHLIDSKTHLVGISSGPEQGTAVSSTAALMFNAGYLHHVGPNRINTTLARNLAAAGICSLRMDFSGLGDSGANNAIHDNIELVTHDAKMAMDFMQQQFGCEKFVLFGLCSGALDALHIAQNDDRVVGVVAVDGIGFRTKRFYLHHFLSHIAPRLLRTRHVRRGMERGASLLRGRLLRAPGKMNTLADDGSLASRSRHAVWQVFSALDGRNVKMRFIYTGGVVNFYNYRDQFADMFGNVKMKSGISWRHFPQADHLFMLQSHRDAFLEDVQQWIVKQFGAEQRAELRSDQLVNRQLGQQSTGQSSLQSGQQQSQQSGQQQSQHKKQPVKRRA